ncbi:MAG: hypothetical protein IPG64_19635 [Haliea sp.]|nr:hypothetical protein [Haliea sp.]
MKEYGCAMSLMTQLISEIEKSPMGSRVLGLDFDGTVIAGYSANTFIRELTGNGVADLSPGVAEFVELMRAMANFGLGNLGFSGMIAINAQDRRGVEEGSIMNSGASSTRSRLCA